MPDDRFDIDRVVWDIDYRAELLRSLKDETERPRQASFAARDHRQPEKSRGGRRAVEA